MPITHFHDGRILITTIAGTPTTSDVAAACAGLGANAKATGSSVLLDARECEARELPDWILQMLDAAGRIPRCAILLTGERPLSCAASFRAVAAEHGAEAQTFDTVGLALRWLWQLEDTNVATVPERYVSAQRLRATAQARSRRASDSGPESTS